MTEHQHEQSREPTEDELRAAYEQQLKQIRVEDVLVQTVLSLINLGSLRAGLLVAMVIPLAMVWSPAWPDPAATSLEFSSTRSSWRRNASSCYASPSRKRATLGSSGTHRPAISLRPRQWQPNPLTLNRGPLR